MTYRFRVRGPMKSSKDSPRGEVEYWEMTEGTLTGTNGEARFSRWRISAVGHQDLFGGGYACTGPPFRFSELFP